MAPYLLIAVIGFILILYLIIVLGPVPKPISKTCSVCGALFSDLDWVYPCPACGKAYHLSHLRRIKERVKGRVKCVLCGAPYKSWRSNIYDTLNADGSCAIIDPSPYFIRDASQEKYPEKKPVGR